LNADTGDLTAMAKSNEDANLPCSNCSAQEFNICHALRQAHDVDAARTDATPDAIAFQSHHVAARRLIWREHDTVPTVPVICQGWAATLLTLSDSRRQILSFLLPGDLVSAILVFDPVCTYSVETITEVRYNGFDRAAVQTALARNPGLLDRLAQVRNDETASADCLTVDLGQRGAAERIARLILNLSERLAQRGLVHDNTMDFPLRQHHIADATGLTVVHTGKVLGEFRRAGLIQIDGRTLTLPDPNGLARAAEMY
jgi:CRP-like cAMP-binding protein